MPENFRDIIRYAADKISKRGVDDFEVYAISSKDNQVEVYQQDIESLSFSESSGIGIRIINNSSVGYAYTSFLEKQQILDCIDRAVANAQATNSEEFNTLPQSDDYLYPAKQGEQELSFDNNFLNYTMNDKALAAKKLEHATKAIDKRIIGISNSSYQDSEAEVILINSNGFFDSYKKSWCYLYVNAISRSGEDTSTGDYFGYGKHLGEIDIENIAGNAAQKSVSVLGGKKIKSRKADLLLHPLVGAQFLSLIAGALTADSIQKGKSLFRGKLSEKLFSLDIDIYDDGVMPAGLASSPFDGEGVYKGKTAVFEKGVLKTYLYNTYTARKDGTKSTGNASRSSYRSVPSVGINNFYIKPGKSSFEKILSSMDEGFYILDIIGLHSGANPVSGDISVGAKGIWVEKGIHSYPVKEVTIATDFLSLLKSIKEVGDNLSFMPLNGFMGSPSLLIDKVMISGT